MGNKIKAAGGVVVHGKKILFIKKNGRWEFPKGRLKKGDKKKEAAIREIFEETGINKKDLEVIKSLIPTHDNVKVRGNTFVKETSWYLIRFLGDSKSKI